MTTPNLQLPEVPEAILTSSDELNDALLTIDGLLQLSVISMSVTVPPSTAVQGDRYIIPADAVGAWSGRTNHIAYRGPTGWRFLVPRNGWNAWVRSEAAFFYFDSGAWTELSAGGGGGGGAADDADLLTWSDETATLTNSRQLAVGTGLTQDDTVAGVRTLRAKQYLQPVANGDPDSPEAVFFDGEFVFVEADLE